MFNFASGSQLKKILSMILFLGFSTTVFAEGQPVPSTPLTTAQKEADLAWYYTIFDQNYAPIEYKQERHHFDYEALKKKALREARATKTNEEFYAVLQKLVAEFEDAHTSTSFTHSDLPGRSRIAFAGFLVDQMGDNFYVREIVPIADPSLLPVKVGDVILEIDGKPVKEYIDRYVAPFRNLGNKESNYMLLANMAFMRDSLKMPIPGDQTIRLKIAPGRPDGQYSPAVKTITTPWIVRDYADFKSEVASISKAESEFKNGGRKILKITDRISGKTFSMAYLDSNKRIISADKLTRPGLAPRESVYERFEFLSQENVTFDAKEIQKKAIQTPLDRLKSEREIPKYANFVDSAHFYPAYIFPSEVLDAEGNPTGKTVTRGYVRIDTFSPDPIKIPGVRGKAGILNPTAKGIGAELRATLANFQQFKVDEVIVDTLGNPGGSLELLLEVSQAFSNKPIDFLSMSVKLNENWMGDIEFLARHMPSPARESYEKALQSMQKSYSEGARMSKPLPMDIIAPFQVLPNTDLKRPFKKVELWVNAGNASCGDIFPAIMQDNGLAKIIGQNTMGAGGNVTSYEQAPNSHAVLRQTESLVFRKDGSLIENVGVKPDLAVDFSEDIRMALRIADYFTGEQPGARKTKTDFDTRASAQDCVNAVTDARLLKPVPNFLK